jgi:hypothetical protein
MKGTGPSNGDIDGSTEKQSDLKTIYGDMLPLFQSIMGDDKDEMNKQKYLELAKFGAGLLAQPGGDLTGAIGKASLKPLEGATRIAEAQRQSKKLPEKLALQEALKQMEPGTLAKQIRDLKGVYPQAKGESKTAYNARLGDKILDRGTATSEATTESRITDRADRLIKDGKVKNDSDAIYTAKSLETAEKNGVPPNKFKILKEGDTPKKDEYYIDYETGSVGRWDGKEFKEPGDTGFTDKKKKS